MVAPVVDATPQQDAVSGVSEARSIHYDKVSSQDQSPAETFLVQPAEDEQQWATTQTDQNPIHMAGQLFAALQPSQQEPFDIASEVARQQQMSYYNMDVEAETMMSFYYPFYETDFGQDCNGLMMITPGIEACY